MIYTTDQILINGVNQIYNGYVYNLDYKPSFGQNPSYCTLDLISEDGTYSIVTGDLQVQVPDTIQVGTGLNLSMYPVNAKFNLSSQGKLLSVRYIDTSIILDKKIVVLNGRQGNNGSANTPIYYNNTGSLITTGNPSSFVYPNDQFNGSCYIPVGRELLRANETIYQVLEVVYTFPELCNAIGLNGIVIAQDSLTLIQNSSQYYATSYIGNLRSVLAQWCTDLGYGFYWENNQLHFIDLTTQLILDTSQYDNMVQEAYTEEWSIEDTVGRVACAFFGQDQTKDTIPYSQDTELNFPVLSLSKLGFSQDQIASVKAAYYGFNYFFGYHFQLNRTYGDQILGIVPGSRKNKTDSTSNLTIATALGELDTNSTPLYNAYWYVQIAVNNIAQANYQLYSKLATQVGKYYVKPMTYGDYKQISTNERTINFYASDVKASTTILSNLAGFLGSSDERLDQFLIGIPYVPPDPNNALESNTNIGNDTSSASNDAVYSSTPYDNQEGFAIIAIENQGWFFASNPSVIITPDVLTNKLFTNGIINDIPEIAELAPSQGQMKTLMDMTDPGLWGNISASNNQITWKLISCSKYLGDNSLLFDILSPEDKISSIDVHVTLDQPYQRIIPKIEQFFRSEIDKTGDKVNCNSNVIKNEINFRTISNSDMLALGRPAGAPFVLGQVYNVFGIPLALPLAPNPANLDEAFIDFTQNLTFSKVDTTIIKTYSFPFINFPISVPISLGNGLMSLSIRIDEKGVNSTYTIGTRLMQIPSVEVIRQNLSFQNKTNESRYLPYGYNQFFVV